MNLARIKRIILLVLTFVFCETIFYITDATIFLFLYFLGLAVLGTTFLKVTNFIVDKIGGIINGKKN